MSYYLSEAYEGLYNPRVDSYLDDNLRFIDFMQDHEIEEVVESVFWELRDYGNTLEESIETLELAASDEIICEAYDDILMEAARPSSRSAVMARRAQAQQGLQTQKARLQTDLRRDARRARVDGAISRVKAGIAGARGGMGRAAKALGGTISKAAQEGKARLGQLLRRGISKVGQSLRSGAYYSGRGMQDTGIKVRKAGIAAASAPAKTKTATIGGRKVSVSYEPTPEAGSKRRALGSLIGKAGRALKRIGSPRSPLPARTILPQSYNAPVTTQKVSGGFDPKKASSRKVDYSRSYGVSSKGKAISSMSPQQQPPAVRSFRSGLGSASQRVAPGTTGARGEKKVRGGAIYSGGKRIREEYDLELLLQYISEDLVNAGYAYSIDEAYEVIDSLDEETLTDVMSEYIY